MSILTVRELTKSYGIDTVLQSISFVLGPAEKVALVGRNGCGKSTLLRLIAGIETPDAGAVSVLPRTHIGYLAQDPDLSGGETLLTAVSAAVPRIRLLEQRLHWAPLAAHPNVAERSRRMPRRKVCAASEGVSAREGDWWAWVSARPISSWR